MDTERVNLTPLAPEPERLEPLVASIMDAAGSELARRAGGTLGVVAGWARPMLRIAAVIIVVATTALALLEPEAEAEPSSVTEAFDIPAPVSEWLAAERAPTTDDLILALEDGR
ncbi:MAG: hypothetical protein GWN71_25735 [Gammaproteobacteria bacterium]|nr:hypothetical protein [Gemmatimonadota bacterium]NIU76836.1 hypothetical protein [Gammaproteobacteria bacterium]